MRIPVSAHQPSPGKSLKSYLVFAILLAMHPGRGRLLSRARTSRIADGEAALNRSGDFLRYSG